MTLKTKAGKTLRFKRAKVDVPVVESKLETSGGKKIGWVTHVRLHDRVRR